MLLCTKQYQKELSSFLMEFTIKIEYVDKDKDIPGSWFGEEEAGIINNTLFIREDTPIHSALHESCHFICMDNQRRKNLNTNAGGDYDEENAVCYLQILLAEQLSFCSSDAIMKDMDDWGYTFRLGSAKAWFLNDAQDAKQWLLDKKCIDKHNQVLFSLCS